MFTGIIETTGRIASHRNGRLVLVPKKHFRNLSDGESIAVSGVCLTVEHRKGAELAFQILPETYRVSTLKHLCPGDSVNLERSLRIGDRVGGHLMAGHVDGQGEIIRRLQKGKTLTLELKIPSGMAHYLIPKGSIACDGVSLTLGPDVQKNRITVYLIPHTAAQTTLGTKSVGSLVNIELDLVAKYLERMLY